VSVTQLPSGINYRICPGCHYRMSQQQLILFERNEPCPKCKKFYLNDFVPSQPTDPIPSKRAA